MKIISKTGLFGSDFVFFKKINSTNIFLNQIIALTIVLFLKKQFNIKTEIKFPNDIYVNKKKICGILIENISEKKDYCIVGVGLNLFSLQNDNFCSIEKEKKITLKFLFHPFLKPF